MSAVPQPAILNADEVAQRLAERRSRVYSLEQVSEMTGFALRTLQRKCRTHEVAHIHRGRTRGMTLHQIEMLVQESAAGGDASEPVDEIEAARVQSRRASRPSRAQKAA